MVYAYIEMELQQVSPRLYDQTHGLPWCRNSDKHKYTDYPNQYKKEAINRVLIDDESIREVSIQLGLSNIGTLTRWIKEYKANGYNIVKKGRRPQPGRTPAPDRWHH